MKLSSFVVVGPLFARPDAAPAVASAAAPSTAPVVAPSSVAVAPMFSQADVDAFVASAVAAVRPKLSIVFSQPPAPKADAKAKKSVTEANVSIYGAFGDPMLASSGWAVARGTDRRLIVFVPSGGGGFYKHIEPRSTRLETPIVVRGVRVDSQDDPAAVAKMESLNAAILAAWSKNPGFGVEVPLAL